MSDERIVHDSADHETRAYHQLMATMAKLIEAVDEVVDGSPDTPGAVRWKLMKATDAARSTLRSALQGGARAAPANVTVKTPLPADRAWLKMFDAPE